VSLSQGDFATLAGGRSVVVANVLDLVLEVKRSLEVGANGTDPVLGGLLDPDLNTRTAGARGKDSAADLLRVRQALSDAREGSVEPHFILLVVVIRLLEVDGPAATVLVGGILPRGVNLALEEVVVPSDLELASGSDVVVQPPKVLDVLELVDLLELLFPVVLRERRASLLLGVFALGLVKVPRPLGLEGMQALGLSRIEGLLYRRRR